jgi:hypothetical protein
LLFCAIEDSEIANYAIELGRATMDKVWNANQQGQQNAAAGNQTGK